MTLNLLGSVARKASANDTILFYFAGHGVRDKGRFYMISKETSVADIPHTALEWSRVGEVLAKSAARVLVVLDACQSGQAGAQQSASNDDSVGPSPR